MLSRSIGRNGARAAAHAACAAALGLALAAGPVRAQTTFDTTGSWNGTSGINNFGPPNTATYGETFVAPSDPVLDDFTFYVEASGSLSTKAYVYAWNGSLFGGGGGGATGSALYASPTSTILSSPQTYTPYTFNTGGVTLTPGQQYVMFLTISNAADYAASTGGSFWGLIPSSHPAGGGGGGFVFDNNGNNFNGLTSAPWDNFADFGSLAFTAHFSQAGPLATPEPGSIAMFGTMAVSGLGLLLRRRRGQARGQNA